MSWSKCDFEAVQNLAAVSGLKAIGFASSS